MTLINKSSTLRFLRKENVEITLLTLTAILTPLIIGSPQILVGSIVNMTLYILAKKFSFKDSLPSIILPSLVVYTSNILFNGATHFLFYFIPIILIGNSVYVILNKYIRNGFIGAVLSSACKSLLLYIFAYVLVKELDLPRILLDSMGVVQLVTGLLGGFLGNFFFSPKS